MSFKRYREVMLPPVHRCLGGLLVTALLVLVAGQGVHKRYPSHNPMHVQRILFFPPRFEYKYSFKPPYLAQKDGSVPFFEYSGKDSDLKRCHYS